MAVTKMRLRVLEDGRPQFQIAADVGCSPARLSEYCLGKRAIPTHLIYEFVRVFRCSPPDFLGMEEDELIVGVD